MPTVYNIPLERTVPLKLASELKKRLFYVSNEITDFRLIEGEQGIGSIEVTSAADSVAFSALAAKINGVVKTDILTQTVFPDKIN